MQRPSPEAKRSEHSTLDVKRIALSNVALVKHDLHDRRHRLCGKRMGQRGVAVGDSCLDSFVGSHKREVVGGNALLCVSEGLTRSNEGVVTGLDLDGATATSQTSAHIARRCRSVCGHGMQGYTRVNTSSMFRWTAAADPGARRRPNIDFTVSHPSPESRSPVVLQRAGFANPRLVHFAVSSSRTAVGDASRARGCPRDPAECLMHPLLSGPHSNVFYFGWLLIARPAFPNSGVVRGVLTVF